jgi:hypothetical protein
MIERARGTGTQWFLPFPADAEDGKVLEPGGKV